MKITIYWLIFILSAGLQITVGQHFGILPIAAPLALIVLFAFSPFLPTEQLLFMALAGGILIDSASASLFGFNIIINILAVLFSKLVLRLGERSQSIYQVILATALFVVLVAFIDLIKIFSFIQINDLSLYGFKVLLEILYCLPLTALAYSIALYVYRYGQNSLNSQLKFEK